MGIARSITRLLHNRTRRDRPAKAGAGAGGSPGSTVTFTCNLCGSHCEVEAAQLRRETPSCAECGSTPRWRAVVYVLSMALFGRGMSIPDFPSRPDLIGIGLSDDWRYAHGLSSKLAYRNTFYDREPRLDITDPPEGLSGTLDFLISSDVFEHVAPPVEDALENSLRLLKPGGAFVLTVPYIPEEAIEHFPNLNEYEVFEFDGLPILVNRTVDGRWEVFDEIRFHGGQGFTLEMRRFNLSSLLQQLRAAGFEEITAWTDPCPQFGIAWEESHGFPITARRPAK